MNAAAHSYFEFPAEPAGSQQPPFVHDIGWRLHYYRRHDKFAKTVCLKADGGLEAVFTSNRALLGRFVRARLRADDAVDDILQELWVKVHALEPGPIAEPLAYLYRMADNLVLDKKRAAARQMARDHAWSERRSNGALPDSDPAPNPERVAVARDFLNRVNARLKLLPARTVEIFHAVRIEKRPQKELAAELGITISAIEKHLQRAYREVIIVREELECDPAPSIPAVLEGVAHDA